MRVGLLQSENPFDKSVHHILPGVLQRLDDIGKKVEGSKHNVCSLINDLKTKLSYTVAHVNEQTRMDLAKSFANIALELSNFQKQQQRSEPVAETPSSPLRAFFNQQQETIVGNTEIVGNTNTGTLNETTTTPPSIDHPDDCYRYLNCRINPKVVKMLDMFSEYFGYYRFTDRPTSGGFNELEIKFGSKWRKRFNGAEKIHFNRVKRLCIAINEHIQGMTTNERLDVQIQTTCQLYDVMYLERRSSLYALIEKLTSDGTIPSGRDRKNNSLS